MNIGKTVRCIRIKKGISKNELCSKTGLNKGYVYRLENDLISPTLLTLEKVAGAIDERLSDIIKVSESESLLSMYQKETDGWSCVADTSSLKDAD